MLVLVRVMGRALILAIRIRIGITVDYLGALARRIRLDVADDVRRRSGLEFGLFIGLGGLRLVFDLALD